MAEGQSGAHGRPHPDALRHAIDHGRTADKVDFADPAAAPLGTDEEAAGTPVRPAAVQRAMTDETARPTGAEAWKLEGGPAYVMLAVVMGVVLVVMFYAISNFR